jgi:purine-binding chemotaxis protein CheW
MTTHSQILSLKIGTQLFGIDICAINDVLRRQDATPVPLSGAHIHGLMNLRGHIVTLIHVYSCLGLNTQDQAKMTIVVEHHKELYGLLFDEVGDILELDSQTLEPAPPTLDASWQHKSDGVFRLAQGLMVLLDPYKLIESAKPETTLS